MKSHLKLPAILVAASSSAFAVPALAATDSTTFQVTAQVNDTCVVSALDLDFGTYNPNAGAQDGQTTIIATCTEGTSYEIGLNTGKNGGDSTTRAMINSNGKKLDYELYKDSSHNNIWKTIGTNPVLGTASGGANTETVYGQIPDSQFVPAGSYSDTINVTIQF